MPFSEYPHADLDQVSVVKEIALVHAGGAVPVDSASQFARQMCLITDQSPGRSTGSSGNARKYWVERGISVLGRLRRGGTRKRGPLVGVFDSACWSSAHTNDRLNLLLKSCAGKLLGATIFKVPCNSGSWSLARKITRIFCWPSGTGERMPTS